MLGLNNTYAVQVDTTVPTATASCSPTSIDTGDAFPCTCSGSAGTNSSLTTTSSTSGSTSSTSLTGTFTYGCTVYDYAGNSASATATYTVEGSSLGGGSSGGGSTTTTSNETLEETQSELVISNSTISLNIGEGDQEIQILNITLENVEIQIQNEIFNLGVGDVQKIDTDGDGYYDLEVLVNSINENNEADLEFKIIYEKIISDEQQEQEEQQKTNKNNFWYWILLGIVIVVILGIVLYKQKKGKRFKLFGY